MSTFDKSLTALQTVLNRPDRVPFCTGTFGWDTNKWHLFYKSNETESKFINFPAADSQIEGLFMECQRSTFRGIKRKDMLDGKYGNAREMDVENFATTFSPYEEGLVGILENVLYFHRLEDMNIKAKLSKLNIYGPGGFFKAHGDTKTSRFGSLVVILPTVHEGGTIIFRHCGKEWTFDSSKAVDTTPNASQGVFVAFFSDVEHEVKPVISGYRVTLTYNLHLGDDSDTDVTSNQFEQEIKEALARLLMDPKAFPIGGFIGFGLKHKYPFFAHDATALSDIQAHLKGTDAMIERACDRLSLPTSVRAIYYDKYDCERAGLFEDYLDLLGYTTDNFLLDDLPGEYHGYAVMDHKQAGFCPRDDHLPIVWVTPLVGTNKSKLAYTADKTELYAHVDLCLIVAIDLHRHHY